MAKLLHTLSQSGTRESLKKKFTSKFLSEERSGTFIDSVALVAPGLLQTLVHLAPPRATPGWDGLRARDPGGRVHRRPWRHPDVTAEDTPTPPY